MNGIIPRKIEQIIRRRFSNFPAVALLGSRQVGKSTLADIFCRESNVGLYLDLERDSDLSKLNEAEVFSCDQSHFLVTEKSPAIFEFRPNR